MYLERYLECQPDLVETDIQLCLLRPQMPSSFCVSVYRSFNLGFRDSRVFGVSLLPGHCQLNSVAVMFSAHVSMAKASNAMIDVGCRR